ncbi:MAG: energy-coupling factor transporter ATPase [Lachnospiraceae bacterium]|nr:energy-coupling factor transporter ATPase [Candidatus Minthocola equi]
MEFIKTEKLSYDYIRRDESDMVAERISALYDLNIEIEKGKFIAIIGRNGSGKSTFARLTNALEKPSEGRIFVDGMDTAEEQHLWDIRQRVGMVFQNPDNQIIGTVIEEDVGFGPENIGVPTEQIGRRVQEALRSVGMEAYAKDSPNKLSGGQKQRIAIAGALAMRPSCIILDESTAMLDPQGRREVIQTVSKLNKSEGITIILITHYMDEAVMADDVIVMHDGRAVLHGSPREVFAHKDELTKYGLELPTATRLADKLRAQGLKLPEVVLNESELVEAICRLS